VLRKFGSHSPHLTEHLCIVKVVTNSDASAAKVGRPRSTQMHSVIRDAVLDSVNDGATLSSLSLAAIAQDTGISRNSIYRRWKSKEQIYSDVLKSMRRQVPDLNEQSARENLIEILTVTRVGSGEQRELRMEQAIVAEEQNFSDLYEQYLAEIVAPLQTAMKLAIRRGKETGEIRTDIDEELLSGVLISVASSRTLSATVGSPDFALANRRIVDLVFDGVAPN
jgi:AcrR family transcriptional regulator